MLVIQQAVREEWPVCRITAVQESGPLLLLGKETMMEQERYLAIPTRIFQGYQQKNEFLEQLKQEAVVSARAQNEQAEETGVRQEFLKECEYSFNADTDHIGRYLYAVTKWSLASKRFLFLRYIILYFVLILVFKLLLFRAGGGVGMVFLWLVLSWAIIGNLIPSRKSYAFLRKETVCINP